MQSSLLQLLDHGSYETLNSLRNPFVENYLDNFIGLCRPSRVVVLADSEEDLELVRNLAFERGEESRLKLSGHTIHFDGIHDLARDLGSTRVLTSPGMQMGKKINTIDREEGLSEIFGLLNGSMRGKDMLVKFYCLGPIDSRFSICAMQVTDSPYVLHSEDLLYRQGYDQMKKLGGSNRFFAFLHSAGELDPRNNTKNYTKRRIYIDVLDGKVYSVNNQYAGNSVGLKKLALRLAIYKANQEDWLAEHMMITGVRSLDNPKRITYFAGAYPSACGKTSTAMIPGNTIVGDDIAYLRPGRNGTCMGVNIEHGIFGIIQDVNPKDDPLIYKSLTTPRELIFSNVLVADGTPYWLGMGRNNIPEVGINFSGEWWKGKKDEDGNEIPYAHANGRYTMRLSELENVDARYDDPTGVPIDGIIYGGRDSDTNVPISEALDWDHGVFLGATLESETTSATIGKTGVRRHDPMANIDFVVVPLGEYLENHFEFGRNLSRRPRIFLTNYFLRKDGRYTNSKLDKKVWIVWAEGRARGEREAVQTPIGYIPKYEDLNELFSKVFNKEYEISDYTYQFSIRLDNHLAKLARMEEVFREERGIPDEFWTTLNRVKKALNDLKSESGSSTVPPSFFG